MNEIKRYHPDPHWGLTKEQVEERIQNNLVNFDDQPKTKSIKKIIKDNFFTYFIFLNIALGSAVFLAGLLNGQFFNGLKNCLFMGVIIINSIISIIEEIISKKIIDRLSIINESSILVLRDGKEVECSLENIVLDDIVKIETGHQIVSDAIILEGEIEVNESFLTGEPNAITKQKNDMILSGSFVVSGTCYAQVEHVGSENYTSKISKEAKYQKPMNSIIMHSFEKVLKGISYLILPIGIIMFWNQLSTTSGNIPEAIFATVAALIGMIPEGLVLLTSSVMAVSVIRLSKYKVLVQQLYCIETLARVDVICLDKTGTLTEGKMEVKELIPIKNTKKEQLEELLTAYAKNTEDTNTTMEAIKAYCKAESNWKSTSKIPFSSERKFSGITFQNNWNIYLGAPEYLLEKKNVENLPGLKDYQSEYRVLLIAKSSEPVSKKPSKLEPLGYILIEDVIRAEAKDTLEYFKKQGVLVKIISGDNSKTVLKIANKLGFQQQSALDTDGLTDEELEKSVMEYDIFGRVKPNQKRKIVETLQASGRCVAMTGDGVNDVLALKKSDCAISIASGSDAARNVSQLILLNDNFNSLPKIVAEGRRTINNIERSSSLLLVKTIYTILLIIFSILVGSKYFFVPIQLTLITTFTIGVPSFILALEPNNDLVKGNFLLKIVSRSLPTALTVVFNVMLITAFSSVFHLSYSFKSTLSVYLTAITGFIFLYKICQPFTKLRVALFTTMLLGFIYCISFQYEFFNLTEFNVQTILIGFVLILDSLYIFKKLYELSIKVFHKLDPTIE